MSEAIREVEKQLRSLLKGEDTSLAIEFNWHKSIYEMIESAVAEDGCYSFGDWVSEEEKQKAIETDSVWRLHWYPDTPIGSYSLLGASLEAVVNAALKGE